MKVSYKSGEENAVPGTQGRSVAFTLIEVVVASGIFFICTFAILGIMSQGLKTAGSLRNTGPTAGMVMADFSLTNKLEEGTASGAFGDTYPDYQWMREVTEAGSNGLYQVDVVVTRNGKINSTLTSYLYRPGSGSSIRGGLRRP